ncbi:MAG: arginine repressor [Clostridia bacterium]|jgi:transcriptional regulator of arginine metabolism|nr:arginine repressor [Clostridia bacterium]
MQRAKRQQKILEIIANKEIDTQEELCDELNKSNFRVTQATISRDVKELKLYKVAGVQKKYRYASLDVDDGVNNRMTSLYKGCVLSINSANNLILVKTMRGNGSTVGVFVDSLKINEIIGSVAGDDTLLIVVDSNEHTPVVVTLLQEYLS